MRRRNIVNETHVARIQTKACPLSIDIAIDKTINQIDRLVLCVVPISNSIIFFFYNSLIFAATAHIHTQNICTICIEYSKFFHLRC